MTALSKPTSEDKSKIHSEVNQIVHQRFLLCTAAITLFGVVIAWLIPKSPLPEGSPIGCLYFYVSTLLSILLFSIFILYISLKRMLRVFTTYLIVTDSSNWEKDYQRFRKSPYQAYTKPQTFVFLILNGVAILFPHFLGLIYSLSFKPTMGLCIQLSVGFITILFMFGMGFLRWFDNEESVRRRWESLG